MKQHNLNSLDERSIKDAYFEDGFIFPLYAFEEDYAQSLIPRFEEVRKRMSNWTRSKQILKSHLVSRWVYEVSTRPQILDAVECALGPNILLWGATFFAKPPAQSLHVGWHQDLLYWGLKPADGVLTVWLALSDASEDNGAMQVVRGSHRGGLRQHGSSHNSRNMLMSDQNIEITDQDRAAASVVELRPGEFSIHHSMTIHGSGPNTSSRNRVGLSINFISTDVVQFKNDGYDVAMLVRGADEYGHFELEPIPETEFSADSINWYQKSIVTPSGLATVEDMVDEMIQFENIK